MDEKEEAWGDEYLAGLPVQEEGCEERGRSRNMQYRWVNSLTSVLRPPGKADTGSLRHGSPDLEGVQDDHVELDAGAVTEGGEAGKQGGLHFQCATLTRTDHLASTSEPACQTTPVGFSGRT